MVDLYGRRRWRAEVARRPGGQRKPSAPRQRVVGTVVAEHMAAQTGEIELGKITVKRRPARDENLQRRRRLTASLTPN